MCIDQQIRHCCPIAAYVYFAFKIGGANKFGRLENALGINDYGQITGYGLVADDAGRLNMRAFLLTPVEQPPPSKVPEPSPLTLIFVTLLSVLGFGLLRRRASATAMLVAASSIGLASGASASLLTPAYEAQLATWLGKGPLTFTKIYDGTSGESHFNGAAWHAAVDGKGATFSLMQVLPGTYESCRTVLVFGNPQCQFQRDLLIESAMIVGGFNPQSWNSSGSYNVVENDADRTAFIFNLSIGILQRQLRSFDINGSAGRFQTYNAVQYGPVFGDGFDLGFSYSDFDLTEGHTYPLSYDALNGQSILGISYGGGRNPGWVSSLKFGALETYTFVLGSRSSNDIPEPSTIALVAMAVLSLFGFGWMRRRAEA